MSVLVEFEPELEVDLAEAQSLGGPSSFRLILLVANLHK